MGLQVSISDGVRCSTKARVTQFGQLVVAPLDYSKLITQVMGTANVAVNYVRPKQGHRIVITDIMLQANKNVTGEAIVNIYTSDVGPDSTVVKEELFTTELIKQSSRDLIGINIITEPGRWVNGKTDDDDVNSTIGYYYVPILDARLALR